MLDAAHHRRFARHLLLAEIGAAGQARLCAARVSLRGSAIDPRVAAVARDYLVRAGLEVVRAQDGITGRREDGKDESSLAHGAEPIDVPVFDARAVSALAGRAELEEAAAALAGAFAAVETIKRVVGVGTPAELPRELCLNAEGRA